MTDNNVVLKTLKVWALAFCMIFAGGAVLTGCEDKGPAEEAGESIDESVEEAGDAMEDAGDEVEDSVD